jgi:hypothetical protein
MAMFKCDYCSWLTENVHRECGTPLCGRSMCRSKHLNHCGRGQNVPPHREPGKRVVPEGIPLRQRKTKTKRGPAQTPRARPVSDPVIAHYAARFESASFLQQSAENSQSRAQDLGYGPLFGVSGWIVTGPIDPLPEGYTRLSSLTSAGFSIVLTPLLGRRGHVTIELSDPVDDEQAARFNAVFGREQ